MTTSAELRAQADELYAQAEILRKKELDSVIRDIKHKMAAFGITTADLDLSFRAGRAKRKPLPASAASYRGPDGKIWSGRGRPPRWMTEALAKGHNREEFKV
jgi:DNA-binding protein H-NS